MRCQKKKDGGWRETREIGRKENKKIKQKHEIENTSGTHFSFLITVSPGKLENKKKNETEEHLGHTLFAVSPGCLDGHGCLRPSDE